MCDENDYNYLSNLTNEELVDYIQLTNEEKYWEALYKKTEGAIYSVFHKKVNKYYKETMREDMLSLLKVGWTKSVVKYDKTKATSSFVAWATTLMEQEYIGFAKKRNKKRDGSSVRSDLIGCVNNANIMANEQKDKAISGCITNILEDKSSQDDFNRMEIKNLVDQKLKLLEKYYPVSHQIIIENIFLRKTQNEIANSCGLKQTSVSRYMKLGKNFLRDTITEVEKEACLYTK